MNEITEKTLRKRENRLRAKEEKRLQQEKEAAKAARLQKKADEKYMGQALKQAEKAGLDYGGGIEIPACLSADSPSVCKESEEEGSN